MSRRVRDLSLCLAALAGGAVLALALGNAPPVGAQAPSTASIEAYDLGWRDPATGNSSTAVAPGGTVTFSYPSGASFHNVEFPDLQPTTCSQAAGNDTGPVPPLPANPDVAGWSGSCRFDNPGAYAFVCGAHPSMSGTVQVGDPGGTTPPPGTTPAPPGDTTPDPGPGATPADTKAPEMTARVKRARPTRRNPRPRSTLVVQLDEAATVSAQLRRCTRGGRRCTRSRRVRSFTKTGGPGTLKIALPRTLPPGRYRLSISGRDSAGNEAKLVVRFTVSR